MLSDATIYDSGHADVEDGTVTRVNQTINSPNFGHLAFPLRLYQVRRLMPSASHGFVRLSALSASLASGRPPFELVDPDDSALGLSPLSGPRSIFPISNFFSSTVLRNLGLATWPPPAFPDADREGGDAANRAALFAFSRWMSSSLLTGTVWHSLAQDATTIIPPLRPYPSDASIAPR